MGLFVSGQGEQHIAMKGRGFYSDVSLGPRAAVEILSDRVVGHLDKSGTLAAKDQICFADFGAADGVLSMPLLNKAVGEIRQAAPDVPIVVYSTDLPDADFKTFFEAIAVGRHDETNYRDNYRDVYAYAVGSSFFGKIFPDNTIDIAFSSSSMHYLSSLPGSLNGHLHSSCVDADTARPFRAQAERDWVEILLHRSQELAPGGLFHIALLGVDEKGRFLGSTEGRRLFDVYHQLWGELSAAGVISQTEFERACFQQHYRTLDEVQKPFKTKKYPDIAETLSLESIESRIVPCPFHQSLKDGMDHRLFAKRFVDTHRSWTEFVFLNALSTDRTGHERTIVINQLYDSYARQVTQEPFLHRKDLVVTYMTIKKK